MYLAMPGMLGEGDIKLAALIGLYLGWPNIVPFIVISILAGAAICILLVLFGKATMKSRVPFAPFLGIGAVTTVLFQAQIWSFIGYMLI
jgi:prepilin signal peptidase PulO-like enzyme (type II secretory pathway)